MSSEKNGIFVVLILLPFSILAGLLNAWVFSVLWGWFMVPLGLTDIDVMHMWGVYILVNAITHRIRSSDIESESRNEISDAYKMAYACAYSYMKPILTLLSGSVIHAFM